MVLAVASVVGCDVIVAVVTATVDGTKVVIGGGVGSKDVVSARVAISIKMSTM